ncbi:DUF6191 domain-containing protein [Streptomyces anulatus]|uniref:DUF6191 domain-containing protein n=1 Tax=Streptomyces anulatus TaxID=1892 RepID=UPI001D18AD11|nr:DUF6191 domain-containing protein [Streptomyces anulatus]
MFNFFEELFAPGRKHASDEQKRLELSRVDLGVGDPDRGPIDLTSGKVTVRAPAPETAPAAPVQDAAPEQDAVLDRPRPGKPASGPERRADEEPGT